MTRARAHAPQERASFKVSRAMCDRSLRRIRASRARIWCIVRGVMKHSGTVFAHALIFLKIHQDVLRDDESPNGRMLTLVAPGKYGAASRKVSRQRPSTDCILQIIQGIDGIEVKLKCAGRNSCLEDIARLTVPRLHSAICIRSSRKTFFGSRSKWPSQVCANEFLNKQRLA